MKKKKLSTHDGYILVENMFSLMIVGVILVGFCSLFLFLKQEERKRQRELAAYQFIYENLLYQEKVHDGMILEKRSGNFDLKGINNSEEPKQTIQVETEGEIFQISIRSRSF